MGILLIQHNTRLTMNVNTINCSLRVIIFIVMMVIYILTQLSFFSIFYMLPLPSKLTFFYDRLNDSKVTGMDAELPAWVTNGSDGALTGSIYLNVAKVTSKCHLFWTANDLGTGDKEHFGRFETQIIPDSRELAPDHDHPTIQCRYGGLKCVSTASIGIATDVIP